LPSRWLRPRDARVRRTLGDDAFHALENDLDWMEVSDPLRAANADATG